MIVKGAARAGPTQLGNYLMRMYGSADLGEYTELLELQSPWASVETNPDRDRAAWQLGQTFRDWQVLAEGTKQGRDGLYHAQICPAATYNMTPEQWIKAADILGEELGLQNQPRAIVLHGGEDRPHIHVVWARTDTEKMKLHSDSYNYVAHEEASKRMELEFGHEFVPGKHTKRDREKQPEFPRAEITTDEWQQAQRLGSDPLSRKGQITALRQASDSGLAFKAGLEEQGYILAKGDQRGFVLVDGSGEMYSLSRHVGDLKGARFRDFMKDIDRDKLPTVEEAVATQEKKRQEEQKQQAEKQQQERQAQEQQADKQKQNQQQNELQIKNEAEEKERQDRYELEVYHHVFKERQDRVMMIIERSKDPQIDLREYRLGLVQQEHEADYRTAQATAMQDFRDSQREETTGIKGFIAAMQSRLNPTLAAEKAREQQGKIADFERRQQQELKDYQVLLEQEKQSALAQFREDLNKEVKKQIQHYQKPGAEELARFLRERQEAKDNSLPPQHLSDKEKLEAARSGQSFVSTTLTPKEIDDLRKAVADRQVQEVAKIRKDQDTEYNGTRDALNNDIKGKLETLDARLEQERQQFDRDNAKSEGLARLNDAAQRLLNPKAAAERDAERERTRLAFEERQKAERQEYRRGLIEARDLQLENLTEKHLLRLSDHATKTVEEFERYIGEKEEAKQIVAQEQEKQREQEKEKTGTALNGRRHPHDKRLTLPATQAEPLL